MGNITPAERAQRVRAGIHNHRQAAVARTKQKPYFCDYGFRARRYAAPPE